MSKTILTCTTHALKEWAVAIDALAQGQTIMLLRKGGIREQGGRFQVAENEVLLYPTYEHQKPELLKSEYAEKVQPVEAGWHPEMIKIKSWAEITDILPVDEESVVQALLPFHIWNEKFVSERLKWKPKQPLYVLLLRTYQLSHVHEIVYRSEYGGCRSWIDLVDPILLKESRPVLSDEDYSRQVNQVYELVQM
jgi:hypothetical protein